MKKKIFLISFLTIVIASAIGARWNDLMPQTIPSADKKTSYAAAWAKVDSLERKGLPQSALEAVNKIYDKAKKENNAPQIVKSLMHRLKFRDQREENAFTDALAEMKKETGAATPPLRNILHSVTAEMFWWYYQTHRWEMMQRTEVRNVANDDIETWDLNRLALEVAFHYGESLKDREKLKTTPVTAFGEIIVEGENDDQLRPSLFDFLAHRAIDFYTNGEAGLSQAADQFRLNDTRYLSPYKEFIALDIPAPEEKLSLQQQALLLLQDLIAFHASARNIPALIDADLKRIDFMDQFAAFPDKSELKEKALSSLESSFISQPASTEVTYELASLYTQRANLYNPLLSDAHKWDRKTAYEYCEKAVDRAPASFGAKKCSALMKQISEQSLGMQIERVNPSKEPFKGLLTYSNLDTVVLRIVRIKEGPPVYNNRMNSEQLLAFYLQQEVVKEWYQPLENDGDFQSHKAEILFPGLELGQYAVLVSTDTSFSKVTYAAECWVSDLSFASRNGSGQETEIYVFNYTTGQPLKDVEITIYEESYDYMKRQNTLEKMKVVSTGEDGKAILSGLDGRKRYQYFFSYEKDRLSTLHTVYAYYHHPQEQREHLRTHFFTDRAIYRPGQTIYFKGILILSKGDERQIVAGKKTTVTFYDVNNQKISELSVQTNNFGTYQGSFTAPSGGLNGVMRIADDHGAHNIHVEEYKRPQFEVSFEPVEGSYKLNEEVTVKGKAVSYSGAALDGAKVSYRVIRTARFPYHPWLSYSYIQPLPETEIVNGELTADEKGAFEVTFKALPQEHVPDDQSPVYNFRILADVTDITGETQSGEKNVSVSKTALVLSTDIPEKLSRQQKNDFHLVTTNLNGSFEPSPVYMIVWKLHHPDTYYRERLWPQPDRHIMSKAAFKKDFPHDVYKDENDVTTWTKEEKVFETNIHTKDTSRYQLKGLSSWKPGRYVVEMKSKDVFGTAVEWKSYFTVFDPGNNELPSNELDWFVPLKAKGEPGEKASFIIGSAARNVNILYEIEHQDKIIKRQWITLSAEQKKVEVPIEEKHRGNFAVHFTFVKHGRLFRHTQTIEVPYTNKKLDISFESFRDKLLPGEKESWKVTIHNHKGDPAAAELMASLYDASLDAFVPHNWHFDLFRTFHPTQELREGDCFQATILRQLNGAPHYETPLPNRSYDQLNWFGYHYGGYFRPMAYNKSRAVADGVQMEAEFSMAEDADMTATTSAPPPAPETGSAREEQEEKTEETPPVSPRKNFNETAFFYPQLATNEKGEVVITFTMPESLTRWKLLGLAHTADLKYGLITRELVTRKNLMVVTNPPRFFRENDQLYFPAKITNLKDEDLQGTAEISFFDPFTNEDITDQLLQNVSPEVGFTVKAQQSSAIGWSISIPEGFSAISCKVTARSGEFTDGEERMLPVLTNRMLVTESLPLPVKGDQKKSFTFDKLLSSGNSSTLKHERLTLEFTENPAWYAVQALPYLMEYPYECSEQVFSRYYANSIASHIANSSPQIRTVFQSWKEIDKEALLSNLQKNQELKSLLLEETPWVMQAKDESERKKRLGLLFDLNRMSNEMTAALAKLQQLQSPNGGWPWFKGMPDDRYITQHIVTGLGHLERLGIKTVRQDERTWSMLKRALEYLDMRMKEDHDWLKTHVKDLSANHLNALQVHYLYARSYFPDIEIQPQYKEAFDYYKGQARQYWTSQNKYLQGMIALALHRMEEAKVAGEIMASLKEHALQDEEMGMYWKSPDGYYWYQAPIEQQALLIEAFDEVANDRESVEEMKVWLLKQKQTQDWKTTKATAEACYALLLKGTSLLENTHRVDIRLGEKLIDPSEDKTLKQEAGTGYFKKTWEGGEIRPEMGNITVERIPLKTGAENTGVSWGAIYWQYFEQLDKITPHETPLSLKKQLFVEKNTPSGPVLEPLTATKLKTGDKVKVRIELRVDRDMEYVHMKDMRASGFEPLNVLSGYRWQNGLGYYESSRDAATHFFFNYLPKGTYVFEYPLRANLSGTFSNGVTTIQCMYAPEFSSHSEGVRVSIGQ